MGRCPSGRVKATKEKMLQEQGLGSLLSNGLYKARYCVFEDDFGPGTLVTDVLPYNWTAAGTGAAVPATADLLDSAFGVLAINTAGTADNGYVSCTTNQEWVIPVANKRILFKCRLDLSQATQCDAYIGVMDVAATDIVGGIQSGIYFRKDDGDANWDFVVEGATVETATTVIATAVAATKVELAFEWLSISTTTGKAWVYVDGVPVDGLNGKYYASDTPNELMGLGLVMQNGDSSNTTMNLDYWGVAVER